MEDKDATEQMKKDAIKKSIELIFQESIKRAIDKFRKGSDNLK